MYAFVDHSSHDYITDDFRTQRAPEIDWFIEPDAPRSVLPTGWTDERLIGFEEDELEAGWKPAQTAQVIGATFFELFDTTNPDYHSIARQAHAWLVNITDAWHGQPERREEYKVTRQLLQGVIDAANRGLSGQPTRWSPSRRGLNLSVTPDTKEAPETGRWYEARGLDGSDWRVRKHGDQVQAHRISDDSSRLLSKRQARAALTVVGLTA